MQLRIDPGRVAVPADLTPTQARVLQHIAEHILTWQRPPTHADIAKHFGWASINAASDVIEALARKGWIALDARSTGGRGKSSIRVLHWPQTEGA